MTLAKAKFEFYQASTGYTFSLTQIVTNEKDATRKYCIVIRREDAIITTFYTGLPFSAAQAKRFLLMFFKKVSA